MASKFRTDVHRMAKSNSLHIVLINLSCFGTSNILSCIILFKTEYNLEIASTIILNFFKINIFIHESFVSIVSCASYMRQRTQYYQYCANAACDEFLLLVEVKIIFLLYREYLYTLIWKI